MIKLSLSAETRQGPPARDQLTDPAVRPLPPRGNAPAAPVGRLDADSRARAGEFLTANHLRHSPVHGCGNLDKGVCMVAATCTEGCAGCHNHTISPQLIWTT